jgi:uncharacterized membrane protein YqaE (UPF0057 family)
MRFRGGLLTDDREVNVLYLLALLLPPLAVLLCGKPVQALLNLILWPLTLHFGAVIHALFVVNNHYADQRNERLLREMRR